jgi:DNA polymerase bacteriophage-type
VSSILHIDFETYSECDLFREGAYKYAQHPSTDIICMGWAFDDDPVDVWCPLAGEPLPREVKRFLAAKMPRSVHAHNAQFERLITTHVLLPKYVGVDAPWALPVEMFYCTAAQAASRALPRSLDDLGRCLNLKTQKDKRGKELIKLLCQPNLLDDGTLGRRYDEDLLEEMYAYCATDVEVERLAEQMTPPLDDNEFAAFVANEKVNDAGLRVDVEFARAASEYADEELDAIKADLCRVSNGQIETPKQYQRLKDFVQPYMEENDDVRKAMTVHKTDRRTGETTVKISLDKDARRKLLAIVDENPEALPQHVVDVINLTDEAGRSSVHKFIAMAERAGSDDRVRGAYMFAGAGQTGRFSSLGLQVHNFPRDCAKDPDAMRDTVIGHYALDNVMDDLASMLRPSIIAPEGYTFVCGDWSAIEARVLPWLGGGNEVLVVFATNDANPELPDIYMVEYANAYGGQADEVDKAQRAIGKVIVLSLGYQGGTRALQAMARAYGVTIDDDEAQRLVSEWRANNPWAVQFWRDIERAAIECVMHPGESVDVGRLTYMCPEDGAPLYCLLPSGRVLSYPQPRVENEDTPHGPQRKLTAIKAQWKPKQGETEWPRVGLYGGLLAENATQAASNCVQRAAMVDLIDRDWPVVGHTHDELLLEVRDDEVEEAKQELKTAMTDLPVWTEGLPMAVEIWSGGRYRK